MGKIEKEEFLKLNNAKNLEEYLKNMVIDILLLQGNPWDETNLRALRRQTQFIEITYPIKTIELNDEEKEYLNTVILKDIYKNIKRLILDPNYPTYDEVVKIIEINRKNWIELSKVHGDVINKLYNPSQDSTLDSIIEEIRVVMPKLSKRYIKNNIYQLENLRALLRFRGIDPDLEKKIGKNEE